ncbi:hypothetical protein DFJ73DRAFT_299442 [Zopfochytrium polystomum]|nr:hypothetical protein DFJ73DRAFT_299442 [Zopfochytrium polystomum]
MMMTAFSDDGDALSPQPETMLPAQLLQAQSAQQHELEGERAPPSVGAPVSLGESPTIVGGVPSPPTRSPPASHHSSVHASSYATQSDSPAPPPPLVHLQTAGDAATLDESTTLLARELSESSSAPEYSLLSAAGVLITEPVLPSSAGPANSHPHPAVADSSSLPSSFTSSAVNASFSSPRAAPAPSRTPRVANGNQDASGASVDAVSSLPHPNIRPRPLHPLNKETLPVPPANQPQPTSLSQPFHRVTQDPQLGQTAHPGNSSLQHQSLRSQQPSKVQHANAVPQKAPAAAQQVQARPPLPTETWTDFRHPSSYREKAYLRTRLYGVKASRAVTYPFETIWDSGAVFVAWTTCVIAVFVGAAGIYITAVSRWMAGVGNRQRRLAGAPAPIPRERLTISVVVPTCQDASTIVRCITRTRGAMTTDASLEFVIVDAGSTDGTVDVVRRLAVEGTHLDCKLRVLEFGLRASRARRMNAGAAAATGQVVLFLLPGILLVS